MGIEAEKNILETHLIDWGRFHHFKGGEDEVTLLLKQFDNVELQDQLEELIHVIVKGELKLRYKFSDDDLQLAFNIYEEEMSATITYAFYLFERNYVWLQLINQHYNVPDKHNLNAPRLGELLRHQIFITTHLMLKQDEILEKIGLEPTSFLADKIQECHLVAEQWNICNFMYEVHESILSIDPDWGKNPFVDSENNVRRFHRDNE